MRLRITKRRVFWLLAIIAFVGAIAVGYGKLQAVWHKSAADRFRTAPIRRGDIKFVVNCTGTVQPLQSVKVGSFVSGPIEKVLVDFNSKVKKDELMAQVDQRTYKSIVARARAALAYKKADVERIKALLENAAKDEQRALKLRAAKKTYISETEVDRFTAERKSLAAQLDVALASVEEAQAGLDEAQANMEFTVIKSPVEGIVIDRKVDTGQTVAAQFQTPDMFTVAMDLDKKINILASIDEADIGLIRKAEAGEVPVRFTVDAYPEENFEGKIKRVRLGPKAAQPNVSVSVVTYTAEVEAPNAELKLLPGMTANLIFQIEKHDQVLKIPNKALRFHPRPEYVHPKHLALLEGLHAEGEEEETAAANTKKADGEEGKSAQTEKPPEEESKSAKTDKPAGEEGKSAQTEKPPEDSDPETAPKKEVKKYVWVIDGNLLSPVEVKIGISDRDNTEMISGDLKEEQKVVTGVKTAAEAAASQQSK